MAKLSEIKQQALQQPETVDPLAASRLLELGSDLRKDKAVTFRLNASLYARFTRCCQNLGSTNSGMLNMLITKFVNENEK